MASLELIKYIEAARAKQITDIDIKSQLLKTGWKDQEIQEVLKPLVNVDNSLIPPSAPHVGMWVSFQYIILFIALYISATAFAGILNHAVDKFIPDALDNIGTSYRTLTNGLMKGYLAALIVSYPIFAFLFLRLKKLSLDKPYTKSIASRKLLVYLTLIVTFIILISYIIGTIYGFLDGSITMRSIAHFMVTTFIAGSIFAYLLHDVKEDRRSL